MIGRCSLAVLMLLGAAASAAIEEEDEAALWRAARGAVSAEPVWRYLDRFPKGIYTERARQRLAVLGAAPGRRFDGQWSGAVRCASGQEWLSLPLELEIDNGAVRTRRGGDGATWVNAEGRIAPNGTIELEGQAGPVGGPLKGAPHQVYLDALVARAEIDARGNLGPLLCVMALQRGE
jgi:hypothetical protein